MFSGTTISYNRMQSSYDQLTTTIFHLHIENFTKILKFMAAILLTFFSVGIVLDTYNLLHPELDPNDYTRLGMWIFKQLVNMLGIITAVFCIVAAKLQSRGSSLKLSKMFTVFSVILMLYLVAECVLNFEDIRRNLEQSYGMSLIGDIYYLSCGLLVIGFLLKFSIGKCRQYHKIVTQAILENTKQALQDFGGASPVANANA